MLLAFHGPASKVVSVNSALPVNGNSVSSMEIQGEGHGPHPMRQMHICESVATTHHVCILHLASSLNILFVKSTEVVVGRHTGLLLFTTGSPIAGV